MAGLTKYIGRGRFRMSRKQALLRNVVLLLAFAFVMVWLVRSYAAAGTPEQAVKEWCSRNFFGEAAVDSICTYTMNDTEHQDVYISKTDEEGNRYEATIYLEKKNPLKWISTGFAYRKGPCIYQLEDDQTLESLAGREGKMRYRGSFADLFSEFGGCAFSSDVVLSKNEKGEKLLCIEVGYLQSLVDSTPAVMVNFQVNLDTGVCTTHKMQRIIEENGTSADGAWPTGILWISEERMRFVAETIYEILKEADQEGVV